MIAHLTGSLKSKSPDHCIVDVNGVGYSVMVTLATFEALPEVGGEVGLTIHTYVREDQLVLFGFSASEEKNLFQKLISISGVGPKMAISILSGLPADDLKTAIGSEDRARIQAIPGVGKKTAERIIIELKDKVAIEIKNADTSGVAPKSKVADDAISALVNLGYQRQLAENTMNKIDFSSDAKLENVIRSALKELAK